MFEDFEVGDLIITTEEINYWTPEWRNQMGLIVVKNEKDNYINFIFFKDGTFEVSITPWMFENYGSIIKKIS